MRLARTCFCAQEQPPQVRQTGRLRHAWSSSPAGNGDVTARSRMEQSDEGSRGRSQLVRSSSRRLLESSQSRLLLHRRRGCLAAPPAESPDDWNFVEAEAAERWHGLSRFVRPSGKPTRVAGTAAAVRIAASTRRRPQQHCVRRPHAKEQAPRPALLRDGRLHDCGAHL
jgi:hypothetical protein